MQRLILEEGGAQRAFRVREGKLTIGSGASCTLRLASPDVAEVHAELEVTGERVVLLPRPGVMPPTVQGRPVKEPTAVPTGSEFRIGGARFLLQAEGQPAAAAPTAAAMPAVKPAVRSGGGARASSAGPARPRRAPRKIQRGIPTWGLAAIVLVVVVIGFFLMRGLVESTGDTRGNPYERLRVAKECFEQSYNQRALDELADVDLELAPELRAEVEELRAKIQSHNETAELVEWNTRGSEFLETQIKRFFSDRMQGDNVPRERARVFVARCREFRRKWPKHPEVGWVERYQERFEPIAALDQPATFADVSFDIETLTWAKPRAYGKAFALLDEFDQRASGPDREAAKELRAKLVTERQDYFTDRMLQAKYYWEKDEPSKSVGELVQLIVYIGDEDMANQAASEMLELPRIDEHLLGYKNHYPDRWNELLQNPLVRAKAGELGLL